VHRDDEPIGEDEGALRPPTVDCNHDRNICDRCLTNCLDNAVQRGLYDDLGCPDPECKRPLQITELKRLLSSQLFEKYED
jgi:hypothetical protein